MKLALIGEGDKLEGLHDRQRKENNFGARKNSNLLGIPMLHFPLSLYRVYHVKLVKLPDC